jgi:ATP-dependent helicase/nuclease subunit A
MSNRAPEPVAEQAYEVDGHRVAADAFYAIACHPDRPVAVEACAGAGKTWMLVVRILRALLKQPAHTPLRPQDILAITFTNKAAGEMRERLHHWLDCFARVPAADVEALEAELKRLHLGWQLLGLETMPKQQAGALLVGLLRRMLVSGQQVQIRTFHSWFASLLKEAPMAVLQQLGLPPDHELQHDDAAILPLVWPRFYAALQADSILQDHYRAMVADHGRHNASLALVSVLKKRVEFTRADEAGVLSAQLHGHTGVLPPHRRAGFEYLESGGALDDWLWQDKQLWVLQSAAVVLGKAHTPALRKFGGNLEQAIQARDAQGLRAALLTKKAEPRSFTALVDPERIAQAAQDIVLRFDAIHDQNLAWQHQLRIIPLGRCLLACYVQAKWDRGWIDMADLERAAHVLLSDASLGAWLQERLDSRIDQVLIDEFQDTNPLQWQVLLQWLSGYPGAGNNMPGVFVVGDPKQSIYRFRRAEPKVFMAAQQFVSTGLGGARLSCDHTRRNAHQVLKAVNKAMADLPGFRPHTTASEVEGEVLALSQIARPTKASKSTDQWRNSLSTPRRTEAAVPRELEAEQAADWIARQIEGGARPQDFMVLARNRAILGPMRDALRERHVAAAVAESTQLIDCCEVQDLVALMDVLVSPHRDLSLARALKSPLFGCSDEDLVSLARRVCAAPARDGEPREPSWWSQLILEPDVSDAAALSTSLLAAGRALVQYRQWAQNLPPHDALSHILHHGDVRAKYAKQVPEALRDSVLANLDAVLQASLNVDGGRYANLYDLVRALKAGRVPVKAKVPPFAVQLLTVHGAKGLQADTVLVMDMDAKSRSGDHVDLLADWPADSPAPRQLLFLTPHAKACDEMSVLLEEEAQAREREELNALYVAMTRAQRCLVFSSNAPHQASKSTSWWQRVLPLAKPVEASAPAVPGDEAAAEAAPQQAFDFLALNWRFEENQRPQAAIENIAISEAEHLAETPLKADRSSLVGEAMHKLLEWQPVGQSDLRLSVSAMQKRAIQRAFGLQEAELALAISLATRIREGEAAWSWLASEVIWAGNEVELVFEGKLLRLDRLVQRRMPTGDAAWWVLDYKSSTQPQRDEGLCAQLTGYVRAVQALHPGDEVRAAFVAGDGRLIQIKT